MYLEQSTSRNWKKMKEKRTAFNASNRNLTEGRRKQLIIRNVVPLSEEKNKSENQRVVARAASLKPARTYPLCHVTRAEWTDWKAFLSAASNRQTPPKRRAYKCTQETVNPF